jgi:hypothetical protein
MKRILITLFLFCSLAFAANAQGHITSGMTGLQLRNVLNANFDTTFNTIRGVSGFPIRIVYPFVLGGTTVTTNAAEFNSLDGVVVSAAELNRLVGVTSGIQSQIDGKANTSHTQAQSTIIALADSLTARYTKTQANTKFNLKLNIADTASAFSKYARKASPVFTGLPKINNDTAATRSYARAVGGGGGGGGGGTWGTITGSLPDQSDLVSALNLKANLNSPNFSGTITGITASMVGLGYVTNESKATMFTNSVLTGTPTISGYVPTSRKVNNHALTGDVSVTAADVSLGNVTNESKSTMFTNPTLTGTATLPATTSIGTVSSTELGYVDNVTSSIQTQLNNKVGIDNPSFTTGITTPAITLGSTTLTATGTELNYVHGVTSAIQTQINAKMTAPNKDQYRIGISDAPVEGDSILTSTSYIGKTLDVYREGHYQYQNTSVNITDGFRFNSGTGQLIFRPVFGDGEQVIIKYY